MAHSLEELKKVQERRNEVKIRTEDGENVQSIAVSMGISETTRGQEKVKQKSK